MSAMRQRPWSKEDIQLGTMPDREGFTAAGSYLWILVLLSGKLEISINTTGCALGFAQKLSMTSLTR